MGNPNAECRMPKEIPMTNSQESGWAIESPSNYHRLPVTKLPVAAGVVFHHWDFGLLSSFVIRHLPSRRHQHDSLPWPQRIMERFWNVFQPVLR